MTIKPNDPRIEPIMEALNQLMKALGMGTKKGKRSKHAISDSDSMLLCCALDDVFENFDWRPLSQANDDGLALDMRMQLAIELLQALKERQDGTHP